MADDALIHVLLVEADAFYASIVKTFLEKERYRVSHASSGEQALRELMDKAPPNLILLAIKLPKKDGFEILETIKTQASLQAIPVIILTELGSREDVCQCFRLGSCEYLIKSQHTLEEIVVVVRRVCGRE